MPRFSLLPQRAFRFFTIFFFLVNHPRAAARLTTRFPRFPQVLGDVDQNSEVIAGGDVFVWGSLRGDVVAGSKGDQRAKVFSLDFRPSSVVIGGVRGGAASARAANATSHASGVPQVAEVCEGQSSTKPNAANNKVVKAGRRVIVSPANGAAARVAEEANKREAAIAAAAPARRAANVTGAYVCAVGFALMFFPAKTFGLVFDVEAITDAWIRVFGVLCVAFGAYYVGAAYGDRAGWGARGFYAATVVGRAFIFAAFLGFAAAGWHPEPAIVGLGFVNLLGALAMWHALAGKKRKGDERATAGGEA